MAVFLAACRSNSSWSGVRPVVPITIAVPVSAASAACCKLASGAVKSITTSASVKSCAGSTPSTTPFDLTPAISPASCPMCGLSARSVAATRCKSSARAISRISMPPIRPPPPGRPILILCDVIMITPSWSCRPAYKLQCPFGKPKLAMTLPADVARSADLVVSPDPFYPFDKAI